MTKNILRLLILSTIFVGLFSSCADKKETLESEDLGYWENQNHNYQPIDVLKREIDKKIIKVQQYLTENALDGILLTQVRNVNWITAGLTNTQIVLNKDVGAASLLIMRNNEKYLICSGSEVGRLMKESLGDLGYTPKVYNWYEANPIKDVRDEVIKNIAGNGKIGSDVDYPGTILVSDSFKKIRYSLTDEEIDRYRWLGTQTTEAVSEVCSLVKPGMDEYEIEALTALKLRAKGIIPTVLLTAVDDRIYDYRHALPGGKVLKNYAMINVVAEKWGMPIAVTRFVHFGEISQELKSKLEKTAIINAKYQAATLPGAKASDIFDSCKKWYAEAGFEGEWQKHHQGGAIGYDDREWVIYPGINEDIQNNQAFAWNPTITGAKIEETIIAKENGFEVITKSKAWPMIIVELNGIEYPQPGILIRDIKSGEIVEQSDYKISEKE
ncbi:MAG: hypothetical protein CVV25_08615 [Ignavibacteriae bacterium HGW-Ignavibacteriae-4]|jgi:antitoxin VapB|nr:MAG: hypothetical protein CVV25_08615 [Ignavibacteriae bacterium HGW-Ignavibacteriae-4]